MAVGGGFLNKLLGVIRVFCRLMDCTSSLAQHDAESGRGVHLNGHHRSGHVSMPVPICLDLPSRSACPDLPAICPATRGGPRAHARRGDMRRYGGDETARALGWTTRIH